MEQVPFTKKLSHPAIHALLRLLFKSEISAPYSQKLANGTNPERDESCPHAISVRTFLILPSNLRMCLQLVSSLQVSKPKCCLHLS